MSWDMTAITVILGAPLRVPQRTNDLMNKKTTRDIGALSDSVPIARFVQA